MGSMSIFSDDVLVLLMVLAGITVAWWGGAVWWTVRRTNLWYGLLVALSAAVLMLAASIVMADILEDSFWAVAVLWAALPCLCAWGAVWLAARRSLNKD
jgi:hypothetical protein